MKILITDGISENGARLLQEAGHEVVQQKLSPEELLKEIGNYHALLVRSATKVRQDAIDAGSQLKVIGRGGVGLDNIDVAYAKEKGIAVLNTPGASSISVAELAIAHMFAICRFVHISNVEMRQGAWPKKDYSKGMELTGKTLGLIGFGNIGQETAKRALGIGMTVIATDPFVKTTDMDVRLVSKDELLAQADVISLHIPFIKEHGPTITAAEFAKMKDGVLLVNCARGGVVVETDLVDALNSGKVRAAGVDVFENEPVTDAQSELINHPRVSVTPHIGASTAEGQARVGVEIAERVIEALKS
ncbi:MAG: D-2-hydroxyacid dehydrogenase [Bacteroidetes bacterium]|nr:D-2-hydroxyacid dehydrogenase [Bacteroidota bacterium]